MLSIEKYNDLLEEEWDRFMLKESMNGTFLQTRKFINYHKKGKFDDCSICIRKGNELVGAILANNREEDGKKTFYAHGGTTFGGISISPKIYNTSSIDELMHLLIQYWKMEGFATIYLKMVPNIYQKNETDLLDYFLYKYGFLCYCELNFFMHLERYKPDIMSQLSSSKRRDYRYSLKNNLEFRRLTTPKEIEEYYDVLIMNLDKLNLHPVHSFDDLYDLRFNRFPEHIDFFGVYLHEKESCKMIAGSMLFYFGEDIVHTQYLSSNEIYLKMFSMDYLIYNLINVAVKRNARVFSFGICTENEGKILNLGLSRFKEGFGTKYCINHTYRYDIDKVN